MRRVKAMREGIDPATVIVLVTVVASDPLLAGRTVGEIAVKGMKMLKERRRRTQRIRPCLGHRRDWQRLTLTLALPQLGPPEGDGAPV